MIEKIIKILEIADVNEFDRAGYEIHTDKQTISITHRPEDWCDLWGYLSSNFRLTNVKNADLLSITKTETSINLETSVGVVQFNIHNGTLGHDIAIEYRTK